MKEESLLLLSDLQKLINQVVLIDYTIIILGGKCMSCNAKKDPNGTWRIQYRWTDWTGTKKKSQKRGFKTKKEAEEWYAHFMLQQSSDPTMTLADFWEIYKADMEKRLRKTTMKQKEYVMNDKVLPYFGKTPINEITAPMIRKWQGEMMEKGFKPTYLKTIHNQLSAILNYAVNFYDLRSNPCRKAGSMGKSKADERPYWTLEEFQKFSDAIMYKQDSLIAFQILFWTGMRIGELLALQVKDIDFEQGRLTVDESLTRLDGEDLIMAPKTESSVRVITIHKELQEELKEYIATLYHVRPGTRLFAGRTKSFFEHEMERGIKLAGVKKITVHVLVTVMQKEADKWMMISDTAKWRTERAKFELEEAERLKKELLGTVDGDDYLKEQVIELRYQNQILREENRSLKDNLEKAYEFMKQFVIGGINLLEKFMEWIGEKVKDVGRGK